MLEVIRNADVEVKLDFLQAAGAFQLTLIIDDRFVHQFPVEAKESQMCMSTEVSVIQAHFNGGTYVFFDGQMVDYRGSEYRGFIHSETGVSELSDRIGVKRYSEVKVTGDKFHEGVNERSQQSRRSIFNRYRGFGSNGIFLGGEAESFQMEVESLGEGGAFENRLIYRWSPFSDKITTSLEVMRLICSNGMVANAPLVTYAVPLINDWERNLSITATQLKPRFNSLLNDRFKDMRSTRASVRQAMDANSLLLARAEDKNIDPTEASKLNSMAYQVSPELHLHKYYKEDLFGDKKAAESFGSHLTQFDVYNILTEASSHYGEQEESDRTIQRFLNAMVFDSNNKKQSLTIEMPESADSDHRRAFFGSSK